MSADHDNRPQFFYSNRSLILRRSEVILSLKVVNRMITELNLRKEVSIQPFLEQKRTIIPILGVSFGQRPPINAQNKRFPFLRPNDLNPTHLLLKLYNNLLTDYLLLLREYNGISLLLPILIPDDNPIKCR